MTTWDDFAASAPDLAAAVRARFTAAKHHVLATLRADGSPRVSGSEVDFRGPNLMVGSMHGARKARDLQRDPRLAIHANPGDGSMEGGDARVAGLAVEIADPAEVAALLDAHEPLEPMHLFRVDITGVVLTSLHPAGDRIVIESWTPGRGVRRIERT